jgi:ankyrin repeat protein
VKRLLELGENPNMLDRVSAFPFSVPFWFTGSSRAHHSPLHFAAESGSLEIVQTLIAAQGDPFLLDVYLRLKTVPFRFVTFISSIQSSSCAHKSVLHVAAEFSHPELVKFFVEIGLSVDAKDANVCFEMKMFCLR